ncbi:MAG: 4Fe-4S dicluster domain-containing protein [Spirochaetaceae bacterium]|nr:4Fe-4S dicluster domain-containing protein [Spirochaetaceae bacterium]
MQSEIIKRTVELFNSEEIVRAIGWRKGDFDYDLNPSIFKSSEDLEKNFVYNDFSSANLSKFLIKISQKEDGKTLVFLKSCDTYSFNSLLQEHRISRDKIYIIGVPCEENLDPSKIKAALGEDVLSMSCDGETVTVETLDGTKTISKSEVILDRCLACKSRKHVVYDELFGEEGEVLDSKRFDQVEILENMKPEERYSFWRTELSRCIGCNACRDICPACTCEKCVFDNRDSGVENKVATNDFEENMFHIIRAFHVAGRCTDCGECSRVCPEDIPLHLLNRKFIKDINEFYGNYQAGDDIETLAPLTRFDAVDVEPSIVKTRENVK